MNFFHKACRVPGVFVFFMLSLATFSTAFGQALISKGRLIGVVRNERNDQLVGATVLLKEKNLSTTTDVNGSFDIDIAPGTYTLVVSYVGHESKEVSAVVITKGEVTKKEIFLAAAGRSDAEVVVTAAVGKRETVASVYRIQKNSISVADVISAEQIKRTPDNNVAQSLSRMNGVTIIDNKFVIVRGMAERYNTVLVNGSQLPSTEPNKKNFAFDLLPAGIIDNIIVSKTASPDLPADFAGGIVQVNTKQIPDRNEIFFQAGLGYNTNSTGQPFYTTKLKKAEYFSFLNREKSWYTREWDPISYFRLRTSANPEDLRQSYRMNSKIPNYWGYYLLGDAMPTQDYQGGFSLRKKFKNNSSFGVLGTASYRNEQLIEDYMRQTYFLDSAQGKKYTFNTSVSGLLSLAYTHKNNKIGFKTIYARKLNYDTYIFSGRNVDLDPIQNYGIYSNLVKVWQNRIDGEHAIRARELKLKWYLDMARVHRDQPEARTMSYKPLIQGSDMYNIELTDKVRPSLGGIFASKLTEERWGGGVDLQIPFTLFNSKQQLRAGASTSTRNTDYIFSFLRPLLGDHDKSDIMYGLPDYAIITERYLKEGYIQYLPLGTRGKKDDDSYEGEQTIHSAYLMSDFKFQRWRITGGLRLEDFSMTVNTGLERDTLSGKITKDTISAIKHTGLFPSANIIYSLNDRSNFRLAVSMTTARPDFRELSPVTYYDFALPGSVMGNPFLTYTSLYNADLRYEFYPSASEIATLTLFYKRFNNPIETLVQPTASSQFAYVNLNQASSTNIGAELDLRKSLAFIYPASKFLKNLFISCNASFMESEVTVDSKALGEVLSRINPTYTIDTANEDVRKRPLQGLSPYSINAGLLYQGEKFGFNIVYNRIGKRLVFLGPEAHTDFYENPRDQIDMQVYGKLLKKKMEIKLNVSDLLGQAFIHYNNSTAASGTTKPNVDPKKGNYNPDYDYVIYSAKRGTGISFSVSIKL
ncbi:TonB-dependent receptor [Flavihumibacter solisilvae]|uniref:TonB-dependent receptor n=1 Tax=Flavihumibacter solisilvae TaxID=1349421 RepID=A0A0C1IHA4_9BACT|nr:TonB-dependent receptor [Flavihumibacter solisilvae]KIC93560.1 hypothetical protein OI18_17660 [Flavihumibacter solisilvae]